MADLLIYGIVGDEWDGLDAKTLVPLISDGNDALEVRLNSPGGYVMEGLAIFNALVRAKAAGRKVTTHIDGLAASMASVIAMAGDEIIMADNALMMIHNPWDVAIGDAAELRRAADQLDVIRDQLVKIYAAQTGIESDALVTMLDAETWLTSERALEQNFVTSIVEPIKAAAIDVSAIGFRKAPKNPLIVQSKEAVMASIRAGAKVGIPAAMAMLASPSQKESAMPEQAIADAVALERTRVTTITSLCSKHRLPQQLATHLIENNTTLAAAREVILEKLAERDDALNIGHSVSREGTLDNPSFHAKAVGDAIYAKMSGKAPEGAAREFMNVSVVDMAREMLARRGVQNAIRMRPNDVLRAALVGGPRADISVTHTTSDFPDLLQSAGRRFLMDQFEAAGSPIKQVARERTAADFRTITGIQLGGFGTLPTIDEAGEYKNDTFKSRKESYKLSTFGKMFNLSRQSLINDDLGAFSDPLRIMARAAAETEAVALAALINSNPALSDAVALFHATHGNLAGAGAVPGLTPLSDARLAMRTQKDLDGVTPLNVTPKYLLAPPKFETTIEQILASIAAATAADVSVFAGKITPLIEPRLNGNPWYLFADPNTAPVLEYAYLDGNQGPFFDQEEGWRVDGVEYKVRLDFGCGIVDYRGAYKNPGA